MLDPQASESEAMAFARAHVSRKTTYDFSVNERLVLQLFFSNHDRYLYLVENLPSNVTASLLAMYSRMKNARGLRGVFVDTLVPSFLVTQLPSFDDGNSSISEYLERNAIRSLDDFISHSLEAHDLFRAFLQHATGDPEYVRSFANSERIRKFLSMWLDAYGHNSIARNGAVAICFEEISTLAAKAVEHVRPGAGFIELSTRYVDMTKASWYPIGEELLAAGIMTSTAVDDLLRLCADAYLEQTQAYDAFLRNYYPDATPQAIFGEVCDVMANALPAATNTSVGCVVSGESLRSLIKCLYLEGLAETTALADALCDELARTGLGQFARHVEPTPFEKRMSGYLAFDRFWGAQADPAGVADLMNWPASSVEEPLLRSLRARGFAYGSMDEAADALMSENDRGEHDKLPPMFEEGHVRFAYVTTFRTWREIQRHVMARNERTLLTPHLGFFKHSKPISAELESVFANLELLSKYLYSRIKGNHPVLPGLEEKLQYILPLGFHVGATFSSNIRNMDFFTWQRSGYNVNHEARQVTLGFDTEMCRKLSWWPKISRTDRTPAYRLAREKTGVPIEMKAAEAA